MTKRGILAVALRILGMLTIVRYLVVLSQVVLMLLMGSARIGSFDKATQIVPSVVGLVLGIVFFAFADLIASRLVSDDELVVIPEWISGPGVLFNMLTQVLGVVLIAKGVPDLVGSLVERWRLTEAGVGVQPRDLEWSSILSMALGVVIGVYLLLGADRLRRLVNGIPEPLDTEEEAL